MIYVIADDLTGAADTGVAFAKRNYNTVIRIVQKEFDYNMPNSCDVAVIDTETRGSEANRAKEKIASVLEKIELSENDVVYKKVDSTLRGCVGAEIEAILSALKYKACVFVPALPVQNRITLGGYQIVNNELIGFSSFYKGNMDAEEASYIPKLLNHYTNLPVGRIDLHEVIKGSREIRNKLKLLISQGIKIVVFDALNHEHLKSIYQSTRGINSILFSGSGGFAAEISGNKHAKTRNSMQKHNYKGPILIAGGSKNSLMHQQLSDLRAKYDTHTLQVSMDKVLNEDKSNIDSLVEEGLNALSEEKSLIIIPEPIVMQNETGNCSPLEKSTPEYCMRNYLGELVSKIINLSNVGCMFLIGGDTAVAVCNHLEIDSIKIIDELVPGVVLSEAKGFHLITKAGGFGEIDTLANIFQYLKGY